MDGPALLRLILGVNPHGQTSVFSGRVYSFGD